MTYSPPPVPLRSSSLAENANNNQLSRWPVVNLPPNDQSKVSLPRGQLVPGGVTSTHRNGTNYPPIVETRQYKPKKPRAIVVATDSRPLNTVQPVAAVPVTKEGDADVGEQYYSPASSDTEDTTEATPATEAKPELSSMESSSANLSNEPTTTRVSAQRGTSCAQVQTDAQQTELTISGGFVGSRQNTRDSEVQTDYSSVPIQLATPYTQAQWNSSNAQLGVSPLADVLVEMVHSEVPGVPSVSSVNSESSISGYRQQYDPDQQASSRIPERYADSQRTEFQRRVSQNEWHVRSHSSPTFTNQSQPSVWSSPTGSVQQPDVPNHHNHYYHGAHTTHIHHHYTNCTIIQQSPNQGANRVYSTAEESESGSEHT